MNTSEVKNNFELKRSEKRRLRKDQKSSEKRRNQLSTNLSINNNQIGT